jgi:V/A-type H+-transporting ATPase subunit G/H
MSESEILEKIKQAESDANAMVKQAHIDRKKAVVAAKDEARKIIHDVEERATGHAAHLLETAREQISEERQNIVLQGRNDANKLLETASGKIDDALDFLLAEFEKVVHAKTEADE